MVKPTSPFQAVVKSDQLVFEAREVIAVLKSDRKFPNDEKAINRIFLGIFRLLTPAKILELGESASLAEFKNLWSKLNNDESILYVLRALQYCGNMAAARFLSERIIEVLKSQDIRRADKEQFLDFLRKEKHSVTNPEVRAILREFDDQIRDQNLPVLASIVPGREGIGLDGIMGTLVDPIQPIKAPTHLESLLPAIDRSFSEASRPIKYDDSDIELLKPLGRYGTIYRTHTMMGHDRLQEVAVKLVRLEPPGEMRNRQSREFELMRDRFHPNIVQLLFSCVVYENYQTCNGIAVMELEWCNYQTLAKRLTEATQLDEFDQIRPWFEQLARAVRFLHVDCDFVHRDIKPANVMMNISPNSGEIVVKLGDFGLLKGFQPKNDPFQTFGDPRYLGTVAYMPPGLASLEKDEDVDGNDKRRDIWSLGAVLFEMATMQPPFGLADGANEAAYRAKMRDNIRCAEIDQSYYTSNLIAMVDRILQEKYSRIPAIQDIIADDGTVTW